MYMYLVLLPLMAYVFNKRYKYLMIAFRNKNKEQITIESIVSLLTVIISIVLIYLIEVKLR